MNSTGFNISKMPKSVTCYICGRGYGTKSIGIHIKNCEKKWEIDQSQKPRKERRPCPQPPKNFLEVISKDKVTHKDLEQLNVKAFEEYNDTALQKCNFCNRTFNPESFKVHQRICSSDNPFKPLKDKTVKSTGTELPQRNIPKMQSSTKHVDNKVSVAKPVNHQKTLELTSNYVFNPISGNKIPEKNNIKSNPNSNHENTISYEELDDAEEETFDQNELSPCSKCGRRFAIDRLSKHEKVCKVNAKPKKVKLFHKKEHNENKEPKESKQKWKQQHEALVANMKYMRELKKVEEQGGDIRKVAPPPSMGIDNDFKQCPHCSRKFNDTAFERHSKVCMNISNKPKPLMRKDVNYGNAKKGVTTTKLRY